MVLPLRDDDPPAHWPWLTWALIAVNAAVFLVLQPPAFQWPVVDEADEARMVAEAEEHVQRWGVVPCEVRRLEPLAAEPTGCDLDALEADPGTLPDDKVVPLSLVTHLFLHGNMAHLVGNMFFLWIFGSRVEGRVGRRPFLALYVATGLVAVGGHVLANLSDVVPAIGASGAVSGVMGAYLVFSPRASVLTLIPAPVLQVVHLPAAVLLGLWFVLEFFTPEGSPVAWVAHVTGMVAGAAVALVVRLRPGAPPAPSSTLPWAARPT
jgi:membrane associated rhomboid family serine protease